MPTALLAGVQITGPSRPNAVCWRVGTFVRHVTRALDDVSPLTVTLLIARGSTGGGGLSAYSRELSSISSVPLCVWRRGAAGFAFARCTRFGERCVAWTRRGRGDVLTTIGVAATGRFKPGTWRSLGRLGADGKSGGAGPAANGPRAGVPWLRSTYTPIQIDASPTSSRMN